MSHPFKSQPDTAFWSKAVSSSWDPSSLVAGATSILRKSDRIASAGSCFAANLVPYLDQHGFHYLREEPRHAFFATAPPENFSYDKFSAAYGNLYTARQFRQVIDRALDEFKPAEDRWIVGDEIVDPYRPGLRYRARSHAEFDALTAQHLQRVRSVFEKATVVIFTLGLTEAWTSATDGAVFPACPGTIAGTFDADRHVFRNFSAEETFADLKYVYRRLRELSADVRLILTVSPVPLVATATADHVLVASTFSKSVLRTACGMMRQEFPEIVYFPAYEIVTGPQAPADFFEADRRSVSKKGVDCVMSALLSCCESSSATATNAASAELAARDADAAAMSELISKIECEEAASGL